MTYRDHLLRKAEAFWEQGYPLPIDLFFEMLTEGIDIGAAEKNFHLTHQYN
jgi:hypothetical protein